MSMLEQVAAYADAAITLDTVGRTLGLADREAFATLVTAVAEGDAPSALGLVAELAARGADLRRFVAEAIEYFRGIFLAQYAPNLEEIVDESADTLAEWVRLAETVPRPDVLRAVDTLGEALLELRQGREERLVIELALLRVTRPETATDTAALAARIDRLETRMQAGSWRRGNADAEEPEVAEPSRRSPEPVVQPVDDPPADSSAPFTTTAEPSREAAEPAVEPVAVDTGASDNGDGPDLAAVETVWPNLVARVREASGPVRHSLLKVAAPHAVDGRKITVALPADPSFYFQRVSQDAGLADTVADIASELLRVPVTVVWTTADLAEAVAEVPETLPAAGELVDSDDGAIDPANMVADMLGGEVVD
jgi:DNA polymerase-3 subunit gamma/tau